MKLLRIIQVLLIFGTYSCQNKIEKNNIDQIENPELKLILKNKSAPSLTFFKDTIILSSSSEVEKMSLFKDEKTSDSIIKSEVYGEGGKTNLTFVFNKKLIKADRIISYYKEPIYINPNPEIQKKITEDLYTSLTTKTELTTLFLESVIFFRKQKIIECENIDLLLDKWGGIYYLYPYQDTSEEKGNYYIEIFKDYLDFGFSGNNDFRFEIKITEKNNTLYIHDKSKIQIEDTLAVLTNKNGKYYVKSKMIRIKRKDIEQNNYGYNFNWKKTVEEVPDN